LLVDSLHSNRLLVEIDLNDCMERKWYGEVSRHQGHFHHDHKNDDNLVGLDTYEIQDHCTEVGQGCPKDINPSELARI